MTEDLSSSFSTVHHSHATWIKQRDDSTGSCGPTKTKAAVKLLSPSQLIVQLFLCLETASVLDPACRWRGAERRYGAGGPEQVLGGSKRHVEVPVVTGWSVTAPSAGVRCRARQVGGSHFIFVQPVQEGYIEQRPPRAEEPRDTVACRLVLMLMLSAAQLRP